MSKANRATSTVDILGSTVSKANRATSSVDILGSTVSKANIATSMIGFYVQHHVVNIGCIGLLYLFFS